MSSALAIPVSEAAAPARSPYFAGPVWDHALIGGLSLMFLSGAPLLDRLPSRSLGEWALILTWIFNYPHFAATSYRLYHSRKNVAQYPVTAIGVPLVLVGAVAMSFAQPEGFAPFFVKLMLLWSPYHYAGQALGISMLYARRSGLYVHKWERLVLSATLFGVYLMMQTRGEANAETAYHGLVLPFVVLPRAVVIGTTVLFAVAAVGFVVVAARWLSRARFRLPPIVLLPTVSLFVWFVLARGPALKFVPVFHSLQYLIIAWAMQLRERSGSRGVVVESLRWAAVNFGGGAFLFEGLPFLIARAGVTLPFTKAVVLAAIQIHHFFVDGVIWKLKSKQVSEPLAR